MPTITDITLYVVRLPLVGRFETSHGAPVAQESALAVVRTDEDFVGLGCVDPQVPYTEEDAFEVVDTARRYLAPPLLGMDGRLVREGRRRMDAVLPGRLATKALLEMALWDILGRAAAMPLHRLLGGAVRASVPLCGWVGFHGSRETAATAEHWVEQGFRAIKVKIGSDLELDVARLRAVREAVGDAVELRVDANEAYTAQAALRAIERMEPFGVVHCEQPVPRWDVEGLAYVAARSPVPIMADEAIAAPRDAVRVIRMGAAQRMKVKVMKQGGILPTLDIIALTAAARIPCTIGHGFGLTVSTLAEAHIAAVCPELLTCSEMGGFLKVGDDVTAERPQLVNGALALPEGHGLGATLDSERLRRFAVAEAQVHAA